MKIKRTIITLLTLSSLLLFGCGSETDKKSEISEAKVSQAESSEEKSDSDTASILPAESTENASQFKVVQDGNKKKLVPKYGHQIVNSEITGIYMNAPKGISIYDGKDLSENTLNIVFPKIIPTADNPLVITSENGSNMNILAAKGEDYDEFMNLEQAECEKTFLDGVKGVFEKCEITLFEKDTYDLYYGAKKAENDSYHGIKMVINAQLQGIPIKQTILLINAVQKDSKGYSYTITYTDMTCGEMDEAIEDSISTIKLSDMSEFAEQYPDPKDLAEFQKEEEENNINHQNPGKVIVTRPNGDSIFKSPSRRKNTSQ